MDTDEANKSISKTEEKTNKLGDTLLNGAKKAGKFAAGLGAFAGGAVTSLIKVATSAADTADEIDKASQRMNISAESYQELSHAASICGVEMSTMEKAAKKLEGTDLSMDDALAQIYALETAEERSAKAAELFGESVAYSMSPMLNESAESMAAMKQEAHDLGLVLSDDAVQSGAELNDVLQNVKDSVIALGTNFGAALMPIVKEASDMIIAFMPTIQELINEIAPVLTDFLTALLPIFLDLAESLLPPLLDIIKALLPLLQLLCELILPVLTKLIEGFSKLLSNVVIPVITNVIKVIREGITNAIENLKAAKEKVLSIFEAIKDGVKKPINAVIEMINKMIDALNALSFDVPDWVPVLGGKTFGFNLKNIPLLANGGNVVGGGTAVVGEAGAELINLPTGATVTPLTRGEDALNTKAILNVMSAMLEEMKLQNESLAETITEAVNGVSIDWNSRNLGRLVKTYA